MEYLYAPWRGTYLQEKSTQKKEMGECPFCSTLSEKNDAENFILKRFKHCALFLNTFPYNPGHLLLIPFDHVKNINDLPIADQHEIIEILAKVVPFLSKNLHNDGTNVGINLGSSAAGGTIPDHLHIHILPRWTGDTNFLPALAQTKQLSKDLKQVYQSLVDAIGSL